MLRRTISKTIEAWCKEGTPKRPKVRKCELNDIVCNKPDSLRAQLATNAYANILASPLRRCGLYGRMFPTKFLLRFGVAWHPETKSRWATPTLGKTMGHGYYVKLQKKLTEHIQKGGHQGIFRGSALYRSDMNKHVEILLFKQLWIEFSKLDISKYDLLLPIDDKRIWKLADRSLASGYQCILMFDSPNNGTVYDARHEINNQTNIPGYNMRQFWADDDIEQIRSRFNNKEPLTLGVPKCISTVQLAELLWRCKQFIH